MLLKNIPGKKEEKKIAKMDPKSRRFYGPHQGSYSKNLASILILSAENPKIDPISKPAFSYFANYELACGLNSNLLRTKLLSLFPYYVKIKINERWKVKSKACLFY